jgi:hypothetical protein
MSVNVLYRTSARATVSQRSREDITRFDREKTIRLGDRTLNRGYG